MIFHHNDEYMVEASHGGNIRRGGDSWAVYVGHCIVLKQPAMFARAIATARLSIFTLDHPQAQSCVWPKMARTPGYGR